MNHFCGVPRVGGDIALGFVLHAPESWPWSTAGSFGLLVGLSVSVVIQLTRSLIWMLKGKGQKDEMGESF
ncbi:MAG: hypothetical protein ACREI3_05740 [Nitrospirales bacterium]